MSELEEMKTELEEADVQDEQTEAMEKPNIQPSPEDVIYEVDVHMNAKVLYDYMLRHTYTSLTGIIATFLGAMCLAFFAGGNGVIYLIAGVFIIAYLPWNLFLSAKRQALNNESFKKPLHYSFTKDGLYVSQEQTGEMQKWENMYQAVATSKSIIIYTSKVSASIFPRADLGNDASTLLQVVSRYMDPKKMKIKQ